MPSVTRWPPVGQPWTATPPGVGGRQLPSSIVTFGSRPGDGPWTPIWASISGPQGLPDGLRQGSHGSLDAQILGRTAMGQQVSNAITTRGAALALDPPAWSTTYLGAVPADATRRALWESLAGQIETWRRLTDHQDLHVLHAAAADLRRDSLRAGLDALIPPAGGPKPPRRGRAAARAGDYACRKRP